LSTRRCGGRVAETKDAAATAAWTRAAQENCASAGVKMAVVVVKVARVIAKAAAGPGQMDGRRQQC
jgi:hypothetical protein